ncbi:hypothetical protein KEM48_007976, partial [Puccinia striiformis f. sp. tritici PST-130]
MLYVDHPVGVGYSVGNAVIDNEYQVANYLCRFLQEWLKVFQRCLRRTFSVRGAMGYTRFMEIDQQADLLFSDQIPTSSSTSVAGESYAG